MPSIREYDVKLKSLTNTKKITKTMKMVSASKLRRAQDAQRHALLYSQRLNELIGALAASVESSDHPLLTPKSDVKNALVLVFTSDKGLCGGFNNNLIKYVNAWKENQGRSFDSVQISCCGRRGFNFFKSRAQISKNYEDFTAHPSFVDASTVGDELSELFRTGEVDEVYLAFNRFISPLSQKPTIEKILPMEPTVVEKGEAISSDFIFEPEKPQLLAELLPRVLHFRLYYALLENAAGEHGARMTSMDSATANATSMIDGYTLLRNRARQAAITTELTEIISGAEAL